MLAAKGKPSLWRGLRGVVNAQVAAGQPRLPLPRRATAATDRDHSAGLATEAAKERALIPPEVAFELLFEVGWESRHQYIDVRTPEEFATRRVQGAISIPYMLKSAAADAAGGGNLKIAAGGLRMAKNPEFLEGIRANFPAVNSQLIIGSANKNRRALAAVELLEKAGYTHILAMEGGLKAWMAEDLPVEPPEETD